MKYTVESRSEYATLAIILINRFDLPKDLVRAQMTRFVREFRVPRAGHPTHRKGHPLPPIAMTLFYADFLRNGICRAATMCIEKQLCEYRLPNSGEKAVCTKSLLALARVIRCMESDPSGNIISLGEWANELQDLAKQSSIELPLFQPADWYRLTVSVLDSLPTNLIDKHFAGFSTTCRYWFPTCHHSFDQVNERLLIHSAPTSGVFDLLSALRAPIPVAISPAPIQCPLCENFEPLHRTELASPKLVQDAHPPSCIWIQLFRTDDSIDDTNNHNSSRPHQRHRDEPSLSRHAVSIPKTIKINTQGKIDQVLSEKTIDPLYDLYAVLIYFSRAERGYPPQEFPQDSGGRFSLVVFLPAAENVTQPFWIQDGQPKIPLNKPQDLKLLETHSHAVFYSIRNKMPR
uniref:Uncharacterized protein n=1 Tax=Aureoumbra lagunensis TaxID=44058 RepID=A0A7S3K406_9STRA